MNFEYYRRNNFALAPIPYGSKNPTGVVASFARDFSTDPDQWIRWHAEHKCNFAAVAGPSNVIVVDVDVKEIGRDAAWVKYYDWLTSRGLPIYQPHVATPSGGWHIYFRLPDDAPSLRQIPLIGPCEGSKKAIVDLRVGNGFVVAAGSYYDGTAKGEPSGYYTLISDAPPYPAPTGLIEHCTRRVERSNEAAIAKAGTYEKGDVEGLLRWLNEQGSFTDYEGWLQAGMALRAEYGDSGLSLWRLTHDNTVTADVEETKWNSFSTEARAGGVTLASLMKQAHADGWKGQLRQSAVSMFGDLPIVTAPPTVPETPKNLIQSSAEFLKDFEPPDYVVDGILQRRFTYSITAQTGVGKTVVAMRTSAHVATGRPLAGREVQQGAVLYFAAENPTDIQMRWLGLTQDMGIDPATADVHFVAGATPLSQIAQRITNEIKDSGIRPALVVVDTSQALYEGSEDNDNVQQREHAQRMRSLTLLPGGPCVVVLCHPTKNASDENLVPRGGGAFLNEIDGNIALRKMDDLLMASALGKFRGPEFEPLYFNLHVVRQHPRLVDSRGRNLLTIVARPADAGAQERQQDAGRANAKSMLRAVDKSPGATPTELARVLGWLLRASVPGKERAPYHVKAGRVLKGLAKEKLVEERQGGWFLTSKGQRSLNDLDRVSAPTVPLPLPALPTLSEQV
jgi:hypothetical protein